MIDDKHLNTLEFPKILARLADQTDFSAGRALALSLRPTIDLDMARSWQQETSEARWLLDTQGAASVGGARDVRPRLEAALRGVVLTPADLLECVETLLSGQRLRKKLQKGAENLPRLAAIAGRIEACPSVVSEVRRCIDDQGQVVDNASPRLARVRRDLKIAYDRLMDRMNRVLNASGNARYLQEALITQRHGRYVIPLKAEFKGQIPGIVHDRSSSGATLFIEPLAAVEITNRWRELQLEEEHEVERILAGLSALVAEWAGAIERTVETLARLDLIFAKARYAESTRATEAQLVPFNQARAIDEGQARHPGSVLRLMQARHPLLDPESVVPVDAYLDAGTYMLVITGPNTGGKTVTLKTVGLLAAMALAGLHIPARDDSTLSVFESLYTDIGDEQSIEQSLSTFSAHLTNIIGILEKATPRSLVLIDELGAGTDPVEGAALARAILAHLRRRGITTLVATHYPDLKAYAHTTPGVANASVEFDLETLSPTFRLNIGLPGRSNAFAIAARLGLSPAVVDQAQRYVSSETKHAEDWLAEIEALREATLGEHGEAQAARERAEAEARRLEARLAEVEEERRRVLTEARAAAREELSRFREEIQRLRRRMATTPEGREVLEQVEERFEALEKEADPPPPPPRPKVLPQEPLRVGDLVRIGDLGVAGQVQEVSEDRVEVQTDRFRVQVRPEDVELSPEPTPPSRPSEREITVPPPPSPGMELHLRGYRVVDALPRLESYLNDAFLAGLPWVHIVHGKGSGALRKAVREALADHSLVASFRDGQEGEGGSGVTVVKLLSRDG
jgi:DNA mismatch repair protein MutS2